MGTVQEHMAPFTESAPRPRAGAGTIAALSRQLPAHTRTHAQTHSLMQTPNTPKQPPTCPNTPASRLYVVPDTHPRPSPRRRNPGAQHPAAPPTDPRALAAAAPGLNAGQHPGGPRCEPPAQLCTERTPGPAQDLRGWEGGREEGRRAAPILQNGDTEARPGPLLAQRAAHTAAAGPNWCFGESCVFSREGQGRSPSSEDASLLPWPPCDPRQAPAAGLAAASFPPLLWLQLFQSPHISASVCHLALLPFETPACSSLPASPPQGSPLELTPSSRLRPALPPHSQLVSSCLPGPGFWVLAAAAHQRRRGAAAGDRDVGGTALSEFPEPWPARPQRPLLGRGGRLACALPAAQGGLCERVPAQAHRKRQGPAPQ